MRNRGHLRLASLAMGLLAALAFAAPAQAAANAQAACVVNGTMNTTGVGILTNVGGYAFDSSGGLGGLGLSCLTNVANDYAIGLVGQLGCW